MDTLIVRIQLYEGFLKTFIENRVEGMQQVDQESSRPICPTLNWLNSIIPMPN